MKIKVEVLGTGCPSCQKLYQDVAEVISKLKIDANLTKVEDLQKIISYGIMSMPALVVNNKVRVTGNVSKEKIRELLINDSDCSCDDNCSC